MAIVASSSFPAHFLLLLLLASSAAARPCKTLLISTYSVSFKPRNPDPHHPRPEFIAVVAELRGFRPDPRSAFPDGPGFYPDTPQFRPHHPRGFLRASEDETLIRHRPDLALGSSASFGDRTLDVLNVLASLLFGAACGALTAGTMYIIWSLFTSRFEAYQSLDDFSDDEDDDDDDDIFNPKKTHIIKDEVCVAVPAPPSSADSTETALLKRESA